MPPDDGLSAEQKNFLQGFAMGSDVARAVRGLPILSGSGAPGGATVTVGGARATPPAPRPPTAAVFPLQVEAQDRFLARGKALSPEEKAKRDKDPFSMWDEMGANAQAGAYPKGTDVFLYKFSGLFQVAPAQDSFMSRLRIPGGFLPSWQFRGVADLARRYGGGHVDCTTRANLQVREIQARDARDYLVGLADYGIVGRGSGADNIRNCTSTPTSGIDPDELIETLPLARAMHHYILNHREMYGLPRKFNIAFEGGGRVASLEDTNDIGFKAVRVAEGAAGLPPGVYFRLTLGGITGHKDFARDTGVLLEPGECVEVAGAIVRAYLKNGDRTDRKKARLKYVLDEWGFPGFLGLVEEELGRPLGRVDLGACEPSKAEDRWAHVGFHPQKQPGRYYVGVVLPVGRMTCEQVEGLAGVAERYGSRAIRLTVWQNLLIPDVAEADVAAVKLAIEGLGLHWDASSVRGGLVACTGNAGCKFAGADTKRHALEIASHLEGRVTPDRPINIHVTGCPNSCAQHYIGDIGLQGTRVEVGEEMVEGYHLVIGGGWGLEQGAGRPLLESLPFGRVPPIIERLIRHYLAHRVGPDESFAAFARRHDLEGLRAVALEDMALA